MSDMDYKIHLDASIEGISSDASVGKVFQPTPGRGSIESLQDLGAEAAWVFDSRHGVEVDGFFENNEEVDSVFGGEIWALQPRNTGAAHPGDPDDPGPRLRSENGFEYADLRTLSETDNGQYTFRALEEVDTGLTDAWYDTGGAIMVVLRKQDPISYTNPELDDRFETIWAQAYSFGRPQIFTRTGWRTEDIEYGSNVDFNRDSGCFGMRWRDEAGDDVAQVASDPGIVGARLYEKWVTIGVTWDREEMVTYLNGEKWSVNPIEGDLLDADDRPFEPKYPFTIGGHREGRHPMMGDVRACAIWLDKVGDEEALAFHRAEHPDFVVGKGAFDE